MQRLILSLGTATWIGMVIACGSGKNSDPPQQEVEPVAEKPKEPVKVNEPSWASPDKAVQQGDLQVQIQKVSIGKVLVKSFIREGESENTLLSIKVELKNINPTKKIEYKSWSGNDFSFERDFGTVVDNFGNNYKRTGFGGGGRPVGAVDKNESIYPDKSITDILVFEAPLDTATHLDLELPAKNYGGEGMIRFRIPMDKVTRE